MAIPFSSSFAFRRVKAEIIRKALMQMQNLERSPEDTLRTLIESSKAASLKGALLKTGRGQERSEVRTPSELKPLIAALLSFPAELSSWLVMIGIMNPSKAITIPPGFQGDVMMAMECANYSDPDLLEKASRHIARSLFLLPSLRLSRAMARDIGMPFGGGRSLAAKDIRVLMNWGYFPADARLTQTSPPGWNCEMRTAVFNSLGSLHPQAPRLLRIDRLEMTAPTPLTRWAHIPDPEALKVIDEGIKLAENGNYGRAIEKFLTAGEIDSIVLPDSFRNQAWVMAKQCQFTEAVDLCDKALAIDPEYAEVWHLKGNCLGKAHRFSAALQAYQKTKELGFSSAGLETNIATCKRAIRDGYS